MKIAKVYKWISQWQTQNADTSNHTKYIIIKQKIFCDVTFVRSSVRKNQMINWSAIATHLHKIIKASHKNVSVGDVKIRFARFEVVPSR